MALPILLSGQALQWAAGHRPHPSVKVDGIEVVIRALRDMKVKDGKRIHEALQRMGEVILKKSQYYVPKDTRALEKSAIILVEGRGFGARLTINYDTPYAGPVHEILTNYHKPPTCAKFLERAVRESRGNCTKILKRQFEATRVL